MDIHYSDLNAKATAKKINGKMPMEIANLVIMIVPLVLEEMPINVYHVQLFYQISSEVNVSQIVIVHNTETKLIIYANHVIQPVKLVPDLTLIIV